MYLTLFFCPLVVVSVSPPDPWENHGQIRTFHTLYRMNPGTWRERGRVNRAICYIGHVIAEGILTINQRNHTRLDRKERTCRMAVRMMKSMTYLYWEDNSSTQWY